MYKTTIHTVHISISSCSECPLKKMTPLEEMEKRYPEWKGAMSGPAYSCVVNGAWVSEHGDSRNSNCPLNHGTVVFGGE